MLNLNFQPNSTVSSGQNALSNMVTEDFIRPFIKTHKMSEKKWVAMSKMIGCALGILIMCGTFLFYTLGDTIAKLAFTIDGIITGPIFGLFLAGLFIPWVTTKVGDFNEDLKFNIPKIFSLHIYRE